MLYAGSCAIVFLYCSVSAVFLMKICHCLLKQVTLLIKVSWYAMYTYVPGNDNSSHSAMVCIFLWAEHGEITRVGVLQTFQIAPRSTGRDKHIQALQNPKITPHSSQKNHLGCPETSICTYPLRLNPKKTLSNSKKLNLLPF